MDSDRLITGAGKYRAPGTNILHREEMYHG